MGTLSLVVMQMLVSVNVECAIPRWTPTAWARGMAEVTQTRIASSFC